MKQKEAVLRPDGLLPKTVRSGKYQSDRVENSFNARRAALRGQNILESFRFAIMCSAAASPQLLEAHTIREAKAPFIGLLPIFLASYSTIIPPVLQFPFRRVTVCKKIPLAASAHHRGGQKECDQPKAEFHQQLREFSKFDVKAYSTCRIKGV